MRRLFLMATVLALVVLAGASGCRKVVAGNQPPAKPGIPDGPANGIIGYSYPFKTAALDPDTDRVSIRFAWGDGDTSVWTELVESGEEVVARSIWEAGGTYNVTAQARDEAGELSEWSGAAEIVIGTNRPPYSASRPEGPSSGIPGAYTLSSTALDPDTDDISIQFVWGDGDTSEWSEFLSSGDTVRMSHLYPYFGVYYVKARAKDPEGDTSNWSPEHALAIVRLVWSYEVGAEVTSSPAIGTDGTVYFGAHDSILYALDSTGGLKWSYPTGGIVRSSPALGADGTVYIGSEDGQLHALNPGGAVRWTFGTDSIIWSSPALGADGTIYFGSDDGNLYALNPDGTEKWRYVTQGRVYSSPAVGSDGTVFVGSGDNHLHAVNPDGTGKWKFETPDYDVGSSPAIGSDGTVYFGSDDHSIHAVNPDGTEKWSHNTGWLKVAGSPAIGPDGTVYIGCSSNALYAMNPDGTEKWVFATRGWITSTPAVDADGNVFFGCYDRYFYSLKPNGTANWLFETEDRVECSPAVGPNGTFYFGSNDGQFYALLGDLDLASSPWPMWRHDVRHTGRSGGR